MSIANQVSAHLPYLRRYARALTGGQASGDAYVAALLEALVEDPSMFRNDHESKVECYRLLNTLWGSLGGSLKSMPQPADHWEAEASRRLEAITPRARQAFILMAVEGFSLDETALVLDTDVEETQELLGRASKEIADQMASQVLIIEDEPLIAIDIEDLVTTLGHTAVGIARTHEEAVKLATATRPDLVLADIQLADGSSGIDAVNDILKDFNVPVVFITAYPERLLTGDKPEPAFLITKPFLPEMVKAIISQALFFDTRAGGGQAAAE